MSLGVQAQAQQYGMAVLGGPLPERAMTQQYNIDGRGELAAALAAAQSEMQNAPLNKVNPHFRSKYADLAAIRDATVPVLSKHGLAIYQVTAYPGDGTFLLITRLVHSSGQSIESVYPIPMLPDKPQAMGSALTYARRYSWAAICGVAADEDDDANAAQGAKHGNGGLKQALVASLEATEPVPPTEEQIAAHAECLAYLEGAKSRDALDARMAETAFIANVAKCTEEQRKNVRAKAGALKRSFASI